MSVSLVARQHGIAPNQLFAWCRLMTQGALTAAGAGEEVVPASDYRALEAQVRELQRMLGKKTMENEILREAVSRVAGPKKCHCARSRCPRMAGERGRRSDRHHTAIALCEKYYNHDLYLRLMEHAGEAEQTDLKMGCADCVLPLILEHNAPRPHVLALIP